MFEKKLPAIPRAMDLAEYNRRYTEPFGKKRHDGKDNMILSRDMFLSMDNVTTRRNANVFVIGGAGSGKTYNFVIPNLLQANCSYVVQDPGGSLFRGYAKYLEYMGYKVKCLNLLHMGQGNHYNPFRYVRCDKDAAMLADALIANTAPADGTKGDPFLYPPERALITALIAYLHHYSGSSQQNFSSIMQILRAASEDGGLCILDALFKEIRELDPESFSVKQYDDFRIWIESSWTLQDTLASALARLRAFDLPEVGELTGTDDIDLDSVGDEMTALFIITPAMDTTFNFLAAMMYSQLIQRAYGYCETTAPFTQAVLDGEGQAVKTFRADNEEESAAKAEEAKKWLKEARNAKIVRKKDMGWYELVMENGEMAAFRGSRKEAKKALDLLQDACVVRNSERSNDGLCLPVHVRMLLDEFANIGQIPRFENVVATSRKYELSVVIILQSQAQIKKMYKYDWSDVAGNCDTLIYLGGRTDMETAKWVSGLIGIRTALRPMRKAALLEKLRDEEAARLRAMPEDECVVLVRGLQAYRGPKYPARRHPMWGLAKKLREKGPYALTEEKRKLFSPVEWGAEEGAEGKPEESLGQG